MLEVNEVLTLIKYLCKTLMGVKLMTFQLPVGRSTTVLWEGHGEQTT